MYTVLYFYTGTDKADLQSLYKLVVPCITNWEDFGAQLGLKSHHLDCISRDNAYNPNRTKDCCRAVFKKWLQLESSPIWDKVEGAVNAIENPITNKVTSKYITEVFISSLATTC